MAVIKYRPEDFEVKELMNLPPKGKGYGLYLLTKKNRTTIDAVKEVADALGVRYRAVSFGGMKDKRAITHQYITVKGVVGRKVGGRGWKITPVGEVSRHVSKDDIVGNEFYITIRDLSSADVERVMEHLEMPGELKVPNYFGPQRFGSYFSGDFPAKAMIQRRYKDALLMLLTPKVRASCESIFRSQHPVWDICVKVARHRWEREVFKFLGRRQGAYRDALRIVPKEQKAIAALAYQSYVWNGAVSYEILRRSDNVFAVEVKGLPLNFSRQPVDLPFDEYPYPSPYLKPEEMPEGMRLFLEKEGIDPTRFKTRVWGVTFPLRYRKVFMIPKLKDAGHSGDDVFRRLKFDIHFVLPKGGYATIFLAYILGELPREGR